MVNWPYLLISLSHPRVRAFPENDLKKPKRVDVSIDYFLRKAFESKLFKKATEAGCGVQL